MSACRLIAVVRDNARPCDAIRLTEQVIVHHVRYYGDTENLITVQHAYADSSGPAWRRALLGVKP